MDATTTTEPESYVRVNIGRTSKGYTHETTASVRAGADVDIAARLADLLAEADAVARAEIERRERLDAEGKEGPAAAA